MAKRSDFYGLEVKDNIWYLVFRPIAPVDIAELQIRPYLSYINVESRAIFKGVMDSISESH